MRASLEDSGPTLRRPAIARIDPAVMIAGCLIFSLVSFLPAILNDTDTLWQIRTGEWILDHCRIPSTDPFSFTAGHRRWFTHEWLSECLMAVAFRTGRMQGIMLMAAAATGLTTALLLHYLRRALPGRYAAMVLVFALCNAAPCVLARPHLIAWPCLALWCGGLVTARANRVAPSYRLLPVMVLWVNLHGSFIIGLLLACAFMIEALLECRDQQVLTRWAKFVAAAWAVSLINPSLFAGVVFPFHLIGMNSLVGIAEWSPADFTHMEPLEITILAVLALGFTGKMRLPPVRSLMILGLVYGALSHVRNEPLLGIVGALVLAGPLGARLMRTGAGRTGPAWQCLSVGAGVVAVAALATRIALPLGPERTGAAFAAALDAVPSALRTQPVLNDYGFGGRLIFSGVRPFIDSRADLYGDRFLSRYERITSPDADALERVLHDYRIAWTIFPPGHPVAAALDKMPGWRRLPDADGVVIHVREDRLP